MEDQRVAEFAKHARNIECIQESEGDGAACRYGGWRMIPSPMQLRCVRILEGLMQEDMAAKVGLSVDQMVSIEGVREHSLDDGIKWLIENYIFLRRWSAAAGRDYPLPACMVVDDVY
jgi:hypothetical protein